MNLKVHLDILPQDAKTNHYGNQLSNHSLLPGRLAVSGVVAVIIGVVVSRLYRVGVFMIGKTLGVVSTL